MLLRAIHLISILICFLYCTYIAAQAVWERNVSSSSSSEAKPMSKNAYQIDPAALAAAALAGILTLSTKEAEYDLLALAASAALVLILIAYSGESNRSTLQSVAFSVVLGLCAVEGVGFLLVWSVKLGLFPRPQKDPNEVSIIPNKYVRAVAFLFGLFWFLYDRYRYRKLWGSYIGPSKFNEVPGDDKSASSA
jgi:hypothetical protein